MGNQNSKADELLAGMSLRNYKKLTQMSSQMDSLTSVETNASTKTSSNISLKKMIRRKGSSSSDASTATTTTSIDYSSNHLLSIERLDQERISQIEYETVNNRRYVKMKNSQFFLPCDDEEADRLVILHFLIKYAFNGNTVSPIIQSLRKKSEENKKDRPQVLDIGCGPGTWVLEMATEFPNTEFHGIDLRTMFPTSIKPTNTHFVQHDFYETLPYPDESVDFIRMRLMLGSMTPPQLTKLLAEIQRVLKPLGYVEFLDVERQIHRPGPICDQLFNKKLSQVMHNNGIDLMASHHLSTLLMSQPAHGGFIDVHQHKVTIPLGWGGQLGEVHAQNIHAHLSSLHPSIKQQLDDDVDEKLKSTIPECNANQSHMNWFVCYGQKPPSDSTSFMMNVTPPTSAKITPTYEYPNNTPMLTPVASPKSSTVNLQQDSPLKDNAWDSINDFVDGYID